MDEKLTGGMTRRRFVKTSVAGSLLAGLGHHGHAHADSTQLIETFRNPPREFTLIPFWFLNDDLKEDELVRQMDDFVAHGVYGLVPHARIGLPESIGWMSDRWLHFLRVIVDHAAKRDMTVVLYDEGMYPSGSCHGQVVAANPKHATRCVLRVPRETIGGEDEVLYDDGKWAYVHVASKGHIRGVHFGTDDGEPGAPPSADILNPEAVTSFLHLTHDKHFQALGDHFGKTIRAIFTDEPSTLGRGARQGAREWTWGFETFLEDYLGYDFRPCLPTLWDDNLPDAGRYQADFRRAVNARLEATYYKPYSEWCVRHGVELTGHPSGPMDIGTLQYFQLPGQDVVWRYLEPFQEKSIEGPQSTMGKCSASAQVNHGRARNMNECFGAYGWEFTRDEMQWVTNWLLVRGVNLLMPHAFYYSIRGPRREERPPDVGPNNVWWPEYKQYADYCRRLCWLLAEGRQVCDVAILGTPIDLPWRAARVLFEHQRDFNYLDTDTLLQRATVSPKGIDVGNTHYRVLVVDGPDTLSSAALKKLKPLVNAGGVLTYADAHAGIDVHCAAAEALIKTLAAHSAPDVTLMPPHSGVRYHHVQHGDCHAYLFTNEGPKPVEASLQVSANGEARWMDPVTAAWLGEPGNQLKLDPIQSRVLWVEPTTS